MTSKDTSPVFYLYISIDKGSKNLKRPSDIGNFIIIFIFCYISDVYKRQIKYMVHIPDRQKICIKFSSDKLRKRKYKSEYCFSLLIYFK